MRRPLLAAALAGLAAAAPGAPAAAPAIPEATIPPPAAVTATADRTTAAVGERVTVEYAARLPEGASLRLTTLVSPARPEGQPATTGFVLDFEPVEPPRVEKPAGGLVTARQSIRVSAFVPGETRIPGPVFEYTAPDGSKAVLRPPALALTVTSRLPEGQDPAQLAPKPEKPVRIPPRSPWFWASIAGAVLAAAALVLWLVKRRKRKGAGGEAPAPPPLPADVELEQALSALAARAASLDGDPRPFFTDLTHAAKRFLERHLGEPVLEWTTFETVRRLRELGAEPPREAALPELLAGADRVKFGRAGATREEADRALASARHLLSWGRVRMAAQAAAAKAAERAAERASPRPAAAKGRVRAAGGAK